MNKIKKKLVAIAVYMAYLCAFTYVIMVFIIDNISDLFKKMLNIKTIKVRKNSGGF